MQARPVPVNEPFKPAKSDRFLTNPKEVVLHSDLRSKERAAFDAAQAEREAQQRVRQAPQKPEVNHPMKEVCTPTSLKTLYESHYSIHCLHI